jgi:predicted ATP-dependent serine protease
VWHSLFYFYLELLGESKARLTTGLSELDRTLGGGLVDGSVVLSVVPVV